MISTKELRLGNLITHKDRVGEIVNLAKNTIHLKLKHSTIKTGGSTSCKVLCFDPIPITEEWLRKNGFECQHIYFLGKLALTTFIIEDLFGIALNRDGDFIIEYAEREVKVKYIHQLQNLYFTLTGKEII